MAQRQSAEWLMGRLATLIEALEISKKMTSDQVIKINHEVTTTCTLSKSSDSDLEETSKLCCTWEIPGDFSIHFFISDPKINQAPTERLVLLFPNGSGTQRKTPTTDAGGPQFRPHQGDHLRGPRCSGRKAWMTWSCFFPR